MILWTRFHSEANWKTVHSTNKNLLKPCLEVFVEWPSASELMTPLAVLGIDM